MTEKRTTLYSLADLRQLFPDSDPAHTTTVSGGDSGTLDILTMLQKAYSGRGRLSPIQAQNRVRAAVNAVLESDATKKEEAGIRIIMTGPPDAESRMVRSLVLTYPIYIVFPYFDKFRFLPTTRLHLSNQYNDSDLIISQDALHKVDKLIVACAELVPEKPFERYNRLSQEIKMADSLIKKQKEAADARAHWYRKPKPQDGLDTIRITPEREELERIKTILIHEFLTDANKFTKEDPFLAPLYIKSSRNAPTSRHITLEMATFSDGSLLERLLDPTVQARVTKGPLGISTNIDLRELSKRRDKYLAGSSLPCDRSSHEIIEILGIRSKF